MSQLPRDGQEKHPSIPPPSNALTADKLDKGCLAPANAAHGTAPTFNLDPAQLSAVKSFLTSAQSSLALNCAAEFSQRQVIAMRCTACHARDAGESLLAQSLDAESQSLHQKYPNPAPAPGELFAAEQRPPHLTYAGGKLRPDWMAKFIGGQIPYKPRFYLRARMPGFDAPRGGAGRGSGCRGRLRPHAPAQPRADPALAEEGRKLSSKIPNVGFSCVQCHSAGDLPPFAAFEARSNQPEIRRRAPPSRLLHAVDSRPAPNRPGRQDAPL